MDRVLPISQSVVTNLLALLTMASLTDCSAPPRAATTIDAPDTEFANSSSECATVKDVASLKYVKHAPESGSIRNDNAVQEFASLWPPNEALKEALARVLSRKRSNGTYADADLGFDVVRASVSLPGGHIWCNVSAVVFHNEFASAKARCSWHLAGNQSECIAERYRAIFGQLVMGTTREEAVARIDYRDVLQKMHATRLAAIGSTSDYELQSGPKASANLTEAEFYLSDPLNEIRVGSVPGRGSLSQPNSPPIGYTAAKTLVDAKALDTLRRVLRSPNPEGRGFAAVGLSVLHALSPDDLQVIDRLKTASAIATKYGCMVTIGSAQHFFDNLQSFHYMFEPDDDAPSE